MEQIKKRKPKRREPTTEELKDQFNEQRERRQRETLAKLLEATRMVEIINEEIGE